MLSATTEHALRAMIHMARLPPGALTLGRDLAQEASIPANYLAKVLLMLRKAGLVETVRGLGGGYRLARPASQIRLIEVVEVFEGPQTKHGCFLGGRHACADREACGVHRAWGEVRRAYVDFLASNTLGDTSAARRSTLVQLSPRTGEAGTGPEGR